jgi:hypothetical protein
MEQGSDDWAGSDMTETEVGVRVFPARLTVRKAKRLHHRQHRPNGEKRCPLLHLLADDPSPPPRHDGINFAKHVG